MRSLAGIACLACLAAAGTSARAFAQESAIGWKLRLDSGAEVDTNIHRVERIEGDEESIQTAPLFRFGANGDLAYRRKKVAASLSVAGTSKLFIGAEGRSENVAAGRARANISAAVGGDGARIGAQAAYFNATGLERIDGEANLGRNFATTLGELVASVPGPSSHRITGVIGYRDFVYKPDEDFNWRGEHFRLGLVSTLWQGDPDLETAAAVDLNLSYGLGRRNYLGAALANGCAAGDDIEPGCFIPTDSSRRDLHHSLVGGISYTGERIYAARYELRINDSNSFGQSLVRQRLELSLTSEIASSDIFATAKIAVLFNHFLDPLLLARDVDAQTFDSIDDENRNSFSLHASRSMSERFALEARYALFTNEFATQERTFRRQIFYAGLVYRWE